MIDEEAVKAIEDLHRLKTEGIITEEEFDQSKQKILFGPRSTRKASQPALPGLPAFTRELPAQADHFGWAVLPLRRYADFEGRSSRREFWMFVLLTNVVVGGLFLLMAGDTNSYGETGVLGKAAVALLIIGLLGAFIPLLAAEVRRLHDMDRSGWLVLVNLVPYLGTAALLIVMAMPGTPGDNRFGPDPTMP